MEKIKDYFNERNVLTIFFPGLIAIYPLILASVNHLSNIKLPEHLPKGEAFYSTISIVIFLVIFVIVYGIGYFIKRVAIRSLETFWDHYIINRHAAIIMELDALNNIPFSQNWYNYLSKRFGIDRYPIMIGFYSNLLNSYHFELSCIIGLFVQCVLMWIFDGNYYFLFNCCSKCILTLITVLVVIWLVCQSKGTAIELFNLRTKIAVLEDGPIIP